MCGRGEVSCDCVELFLCSFPYSDTKYDRRGKVFSSSSRIFV